MAAKETHNPRDFVIEVIKNFPTATRKEMFNQFRKLLQEHPDAYQSAVDWYFFVNMHDYLVGSRNQKTDPVERAQAKHGQSEMIENVKAQIVLLDLTMTNGKLLGDCTGAELSTMSSRFQKLADRVGKAKTVRSVLTEDQVKAIMK